MTFAGTKTSALAGSTASESDSFGLGFGSCVPASFIEAMVTATGIVLVAMAPCAAEKSPNDAMTP